MHLRCIVDAFNKKEKKMKIFRFAAIMAIIMLLLGASQVWGAITLATANPTPDFSNTTKDQKFLRTAVTADAGDTLSSVEYTITYDPDYVEVVRLIPGSTISSLTSPPPKLDDFDNTTGTASFSSGGAVITATGGWTSQPLIDVELNYKTENWYKQTLIPITVSIKIDSVVVAAGTPVITPPFGDTGDLNADGNVDIADAYEGVSYLNSSSPAALEPWEIQIWDVSNDDEFDIYDIALLVQNAAAAITFPRDVAGATQAPGNQVLQICTISLANAELVGGNSIFQTKIKIDSVNATAIMVRIEFDKTAIKVLEAKINPEIVIAQPQGFSFPYKNNQTGKVAFCLVRMDALIAKNLDFATIVFKAEIQDSFVMRPIDSDIYNQNNKAKVLGFEPEDDVKTDSSDVIGFGQGIKLEDGFIEKEKQIPSLKMKPLETELLQNYPNPFNPETWIPYRLAKDANVIISIYNIHGQIIRVMDLGSQRVGAHIQKFESAHWDGRNNAGDLVSSGIYFFTLQTDKFYTTRRMTVVK